MKARGAGQAVARLGILRLVILGAALAVSLPFDVYAVAAAVLATRVLAAGATLYVARQVIAPEPNQALAAASHVVVTWGVAFPLAAVAVSNTLNARPAGDLAVSLLLGAGIWLGLRALLDRASLRREWSVLVRIAGRDAS